MKTILFSFLNYCLVFFTSSTLLNRAQCCTSNDNDDIKLGFKDSSGDKSTSVNIEEIDVDRTIKLLNKNVYENDPFEIDDFGRRIARLEHLFNARPDLVEDYNSQLEDNITIIDFISKHARKGLRARHLLPLSDKECYWDIFSERYCLILLFVCLCCCKKIF